MNNCLENLKERKKIALLNAEKFKEIPEKYNSFIKYSKNLDKEIEKFTNEITDINDLNSIFNEIDENKEISEYLKIFLNNGFKEHYQVNNYITQKNMWNNFKIIRSLNDHGEHKNIKGIQPKYYAIICKRLNISGAGGKQLDGVHLY